MNGLEFIASLVRSLAWPVTIVVVVVLLRRPIVDLLAAPLKRLKVGAAGFEVEWREAARLVATETGAPSVPEAGRPDSEFQLEMRQLAREASPTAAVAASLNRVGGALRERLATDGADDLDGLNVGELVRLAHDRGLVDDATVNAVDGLAVMHMLGVLDGGRHLDVQRAEEFAVLADAVLMTLRLQQ